MTEPVTVVGEPRVVQRRGFGADGDGHRLATLIEEIPRHQSVVVEHEPRPGADALLAPSVDQEDISGTEGGAALAPRRDPGIVAPARFEVVPGAVRVRVPRA